MVLNERDGHSIYNSADLKNWEYKSHVTGFWECPELFELPVDGDKNHTKWVMYGASVPICWAHSMDRRLPGSRQILLLYRKHVCCPDL